MAGTIKFDEVAVLSVQSCLTNVNKSLRDVRSQLSVAKSLSSEDWTEAESQVFQGNCDVLDAASKEMIIDVKHRITSLKEVMSRFQNAESSSKKTTSSLSTDNIFKK